MKKTILIAGSTGEIGSALSDYFSSHDINLVLAGRDEEKLLKLKNKFKTSKAKIFTTEINYNIQATYKNAIEICDNKLDALILIPPKINQTNSCMPSKQEWLNTFENVFVNPLEFFLTQIPILSNAKPAKVVVISGISSRTLLSNYAANGAIRAAWHAQVKAMAFEYGNIGIHINTLSFGGIMTNSFIQQAQNEAESKNMTFSEIMKEKTSNVPLKKYASFEDVCHAVNGLIGSFSNHMTGQNFICDGGFLKVY